MIHKFGKKNGMVASVETTDDEVHEVVIKIGGKTIKILADDSDALVLITKGRYNKQEESFEKEALFYTEEML